jgi:hypothetical protein
MPRSGGVEKVGQAIPPAPLPLGLGSVTSIKPPGRQSPVAVFDQGLGPLAGGLQLLRWELIEQALLGPVARPGKAVAQLLLTNALPAAAAPPAGARGIRRRDP